VDALGAFLLAGVLMLTKSAVGTAQDRPAVKLAEGGTVAPRYTIVATEGHNLLVTDNQANTVYFYTIKPDEKIGSDLHLRGSVDLAQVGKPTIKVNTVKAPAKDKGDKE
jgi:hypothetical protein